MHIKMRPLVCQKCHCLKTISHDMETYNLIDFTEGSCARRASPLLSSTSGTFKGIISLLQVELIWMKPWSPGRTAFADTDFLTCTDTGALRP
jgi:hypothetical protein